MVRLTADNRLIYNACKSLFVQDSAANAPNIADLILASTYEEISETEEF
jgi:hypothetical protein